MKDQSGQISKSNLEESQSLITAIIGMQFIKIVKAVTQTILCISLQPYRTRSVIVYLLRTIQYLVKGCHLINLT